MEQPLFHVVLEGRRVGPYDRRTIVGMRIKNALGSQHELVGTDGSRLTVGDLVRQRVDTAQFQPHRSGSFSIVRATYAAALRGVSGRGLAIPPFQGEVQLRVQQDVLRLAGRVRRWPLGWKDERVKLPLAHIMHAQARGSEVLLELGRSDSASAQRIRLDLLTTQAAAELVGWLPQARARPDAAAMREHPAQAGLVRGGAGLLWVSLGSATCVAVVLLAVLLARRLY